MTPKERMLAAARGRMPDQLPYAPRIDLWFSANKARATLPDRYRDARSADEIALGEGWALHKVVLEFMRSGVDAVIDRCLGVYRAPTQSFISELPDGVERVVEERNGEFWVTYITPKGTARACFVYTAEMSRSGISIPWIKEHIIKDEADYPVVGYLFEHMKVVPAYEQYRRWSDAIGTNGLPVAYAMTSGSPMHHIMKILLDPTDFYYRERDQAGQIAGLAEQIGVYFRKVCDVSAKGPADVVFVGGNFDDMLTYRPFFEKQIMPWLQEAAGRLHDNGKLLLCHTDGENHGLMDLLHACGMDVAEAVCPYPMTKVTIAEYYRKWSDRVTIFGGIPSNILLKETTSDEVFEKYIEELFAAIAPGSRFILGVADTTPPDACFERLQFIQKAVEGLGPLPIEKRESTASVFPEAPIGRVEISMPTANQEMAAVTELPDGEEIRQAVMGGDSDQTVLMVRRALEQGVDAELLLRECLLAPMDAIGEKFTDGTVFIPEVLLCARALNEAMKHVDAALARQGIDQGKKRRVLIGTVKGDMHDIGKNLVAIILRSSGFEVKDLGVNVAAQTFVDAVAAEKPDILALSALLTTTMPEFKNVIEAIEKAGLRDKVKILVGGAPVTERYAKGVGADAYGADAGQAALKAKQMCGILQAKSQEATSGLERGRRASGPSPIA